MNDILNLLETDYKIKPEFKEIIDKIPIIESIYKGLQIKDIPKIVEMIEIIKLNDINDKITFGNITYDRDDFINIDISKIVEDEKTKLIGLSYKNEKLVRKLKLHNKNMIECLKILNNYSDDEAIEMFNTLVYSCTSIYLIIKDDFFEKIISKKVFNLLESYKKIILNILAEY